jgi:hypothetical protein
MKTFIRIVLFTFFLQSTSFAQTINGKIFENQSKTPVPFCSIYVPNKVGVNCDENGQFQIALNNVLPTDTITVSCVGYKTVNMPKSEFVKNTTFFLVENTELLNAVIIKPIGKEVILGRKEEGGIVAILFVTDDKTNVDTIRNAEIGMIMDNNRPIALQEVGLYLKENTFETLAFRLNIYDAKRGLPNESILQKQIFTTIKDKKSGWVTFDISNQNIITKEDIICTVEILSISPKNGRFALVASLNVLKKRTLGRGFSKGKWKKAPVNLGMYAKGVEVK